MKKIILSLLLGVFVFASIIPVHANSIHSLNIIPTIDEYATKENGYPVINLKNTSSRNLIVTYNFHITDSSSTHVDQVVSTIHVPANSDVVLELHELSILGGTNQVRRVWFSWESPIKGKPLESYIDTIPFNAVFESK